MSRRIVPCLAILSIRTACISTISFQVLNPISLCEGKNDPTDWIKDFSGKFDVNDILSKISSLSSPDAIDKASRAAYGLIESGTPGQFGYGFTMGYASGFCVKRVAKVGAFVIGGIFIIFQGFAYKGYVQVNQERIKADFEV